MSKDKKEQQAALEQGDKRDLVSLKNKVRTALDLDVWKNSWHLPKNPSGNTDWYSIETYAQVKKVIEEKITDADARITFLGKLLFDDIDWEYPLRQLEDDLRTVEYCILENDIAPGETLEDLIHERKELEAKIDKYKPILGTEK